MKKDSTDTPETDQKVKRICGNWNNAGDRIQEFVLADVARKMEADRDHWRNEHDRILREFQHRLTVLATSAIEATNYPENERGLATAPQNSDS